MCARMGSNMFGAWWAFTAASNLLPTTNPTLDESVTFYTAAPSTGATMFPSRTVHWWVPWGADLVTLVSLCRNCHLPSALFQTTHFLGLQWWGQGSHFHSICPTFLCRYSKPQKVVWILSSNLELQRCVFFRQKKVLQEIRPRSVDWQRCEKNNFTKNTETPDDKCDMQKMT